MFFALAVLVGASTGSFAQGGAITFPADGRYLISLPQTITAPGSAALMPFATSCMQPAS